jgi:nicotinamidase-related amidase
LSVNRQRAEASFHGTDLEVILRSRGIDTFILGGINTNVCVDTTARGRGAGVPGVVPLYHRAFAAAGLLEA